MKYFKQRKEIMLIFEIFNKVYAVFNISTKILLFSDKLETCMFDCG